MFELVSRGEIEAVGPTTAEGREISPSTVVNDDGLRANRVRWEVEQFVDAHWILGEAKNWPPQQLTKLSWGHGDVG